MKANKLTIEEQFLTLDQAKELQELGVDIYGNFEIDIDDNGFETIEKVGTFASDTFEYYKKSIPTLSVAEMLEMLPKCIEVKDVLYELYLKKSSFYVKNIAYELGYRGYLNELLCINKYIHTLLRDSLFEMLKWLKQNKLI